MTAHEILAGLLAAFRQAAPGAEFREAYGPQPASRRQGRALVAGRVEKETVGPQGWQAQLGFTIYLPPAAAPSQAQSLAWAMDAAARGAQPLLTETAFGPAAADTVLGGTAMDCTFRFAGPAPVGSAGHGREPIRLNGTAFTAAAWKESISIKGPALTAIGEDTPFWVGQGREYTLELQGLPPAALAAGDGFTLALEGRGWQYGGCRWKSRNGTGTAVVVSNTKTQLDEEE